MNKKGGQFATDFTVLNLPKLALGLMIGLSTLPSSQVDSSSPCIITCRLQVPYLVLFYFFYSAINVANVSREARHCQLIYWFIRTLGPTPVNTVESAFIKSQTWRNTPTFTPVSLALPKGRFFQKVWWIFLIAQKMYQKLSWKRDFEIAFSLESADSNCK